MFIECASCPARGLRCDDCVVTVLDTIPVRIAEGEESLGAQGLALDPAERRAVDLFVAAGLVEIGYAATVRARREPGQSRAVG